MSETSGDVVQQRGGHSQSLSRNRDFMLLMLGQAGSLVGSSMTSLALVMLAYAITGSTAQAGLASAAYGVGMAVMMLPAGAVVDRVNRKRVMVITALASAIILVTVPAADAVLSVTFPHLLLVALLGGALTCYYNPAEMASLKAVVPPRQMGAAMAANQGRGAAASLVGPPLAGVLFGIGRSLPFLIDAVTFLGAAACAAFVRSPLPAPARVRRQRLTRDVLDGVSWLRRVRPVRDLVLSSLLANVAFTGVATTTLLALQQNGTSSRGLGFLQASYGLAGIAGSLLAPAILARLRVGTLVRSVFWFLVALYLLLPLSPSIWWVGTLVALGYLAVRPSNSAMSAYQIHVTPDGMVGRAESAAAFGRVAMIPLGAAASGILLDLLGRTPTVLIFTGVMISGALIAGFSRSVRSIPQTAHLGRVQELD